MKYTVKLLETDVINKNNRVYPKEVVEKINKQLNSNTINVYNQTALGKQNPPLNAFIGQTVKYSLRIEKDTLFVDVKLIKPVNAKFINLCCLGNINLCYLGNINLSNKPKKDYNGNITAGLDGFSHNEVKEPDVVYLFEDNTNSYYDDSNIISQNNKLEIE